MEENTEEIVEPFNIHDPYECKVYMPPDHRVGYKECRCGKPCPIMDRYCGGCGQKLVIPDFEN